MRCRHRSSCLAHRRWANDHRLRRCRAGRLAPSSRFGQERSRSGGRAGLGSPEQASPEQASPEQASPEQASPDQASPDQASPERASPEQASPASPDQASLDQASSGRQASTVGLLAATGQALPSRWARLSRVSRGSRRLSRPRTLGPGQTGRAQPARRSGSGRTLPRRLPLTADQAVRRRSASQEIRPKPLSRRRRRQRPAPSRDQASRDRPASPARELAGSRGQLDSRGRAMLQLVQLGPPQRR